MTRAMSHFFFLLIRNHLMQKSRFITRGAHGNEQTDMVRQRSLTFVRMSVRTKFQKSFVTDVNEQRYKTHQWS